MAVLEKLKLVTLGPKRKASAEQERRQKLVQQLSEQLKLAEAALGGTAYERTKQSWGTDAGGVRIRVEKPVKVRQWWQVGDGGVVQFGLRYGAVPLELKKGMNAVEVAKLVDLPALIKSLVQAVELGELDTAIEMTVTARKSGSRTVMVPKE